MSWFLEQLSTVDNSEDYKEREEERVYLQERIVHLTHELEQARLYGIQTQSQLQEQHQAELESWQNRLSGVHSSTEQLNDEAEYWHQEIALLQEKVAQAETQNRDLVQSLQPKDWEASAASDGSAEALRQQLLAGKASEASLKGVITAKKLLLEDAKREQQDLQSLVRLKEQQLEVLATEARQLQLLRDSELQQLQTRLAEPPVTQTVSNKDLAPQVQASQRTIEGLLTEKAGLVLKLEVHRSAPQPAATHHHGSRMAAMKLFRGHRSLRKVVDILDDMVTEVQSLADEQAVVRLGLVLYMVVLHLWVLLAALDMRGCSSFMS